MENNNIHTCAKISVNCTKNDPVDIKAGGPEWLGFDFYVKYEEAESIMEYIDALLTSFEIPYENISIVQILDTSLKNIWTKERILSEIAKDSEYLKHESTRYYSTHCQSLK